MDREVKEVPRRRRSPLRLILDTSVFTNPDAYRAFGNNPTDALNGFLQLAAKTKGIEFFMPTSIYNELMAFVEPASLPPNLQLIIQRKSPRKYEMTVPASLLYELIHDVRVRVDKGLRVAERAIEAIRKDLKVAEEAARTSQEGLFATLHASAAEHIATLRKRYREALREGIIDSKEDVELILLAMEVDGVVVTADRGIITWVEKLGIRWLDASNLRGIMDSLVKKR